MTRASGAVSATLSARPFRCCSSASIAFDDPLLIRVVQRDFLLQDKQEVGLPRAFEALGDRLPAWRECPGG